MDKNTVYETCVVIQRKLKKSSPLNTIEFGPSLCLITSPLVTIIYSSKKAIILLSSAICCTYKEKNLIPPLHSLITLYLFSYFHPQTCFLHLHYYQFFSSHLFLFQMLSIDLLSSSSAIRCMMME